MIVLDSIAQEMIRNGKLQWDEYFIDLEGNYYITRNKLKQMYS